MSRSRASVFRGPGYRAQQRQLVERQRRRAEAPGTRAVRRMVAAGPAKPKLADRILPWRKRKHREAEESRKRLEAQLAKHDQQFGEWHAARRIQLACWRGILTMAERRRLVKIGTKRIEQGVAWRYDHPQQRRMERLHRQGRLDQLNKLMVECGMRPLGA